jgi:hypothetical protein
MPGERDDGRGGAEGFPGGLFRGKAGRVSFGFAGDPFAILNFTFGKDAIDEAVSVFPNCAFEPRYFNYVYADACYHKVISNSGFEI